MNILLTSAGRRTYLINYFKDAIGGDGQIHASNSVYTNTLSYADRYIITPQIYDKEYLDFLLQYCRENAIAAIISLFDIDLPILSAHKDDFKKNGVQLVVSNVNAIKICNDKWLTYKFLLQIGLKTPWSCISLDELKKGIFEKQIQYPIILKPRWGMGSIGIYQVDNDLELEVLYKKLQRQIFDTYLRFESSEDRDHCIIFQEKIKGQEYGLDVLNDLDSNYVTTIAKKKVAMRAGETDIAEIVNPEPFFGIARKLSHELGHIANLDVDCFVNEDGEIYVLEMNCRFGGQYPFSHIAGANFPKQIIKWLNNEPTDFNLVTPRVGCIGCKELLPTLISPKKQ